MDYTLLKSALVAASLGLCSTALAQNQGFTGGQDWTGATETLYFEYDRSANQAVVDTDRIKQVLQSCNVNAINIVGHADTDGNAEYNVGLSERRANRIKAQIVSWGLLDGNSITTRGAGETELAVQTGDNVKEALNRRAEIQFSFSQPCGLYYTAPPAETVIYEPAPEPVVYSDPAPVYSDPAPVVTTPAPSPVVTTPAPVAAPPAPVVAAPPPAPVVAAPPPVPAASGTLLIPAAVGALAVAGVLLLDDDDDDDEVPQPPQPVSP